VRGALDTLRDLAATHGLELAHVQAGDGPSGGMPAAEPDSCELIVAIGGDGTVLRALHAAAETHTPVLGVACGSLGALSTVSPAELRAGFDRIAAGDWRGRTLPALAAETTEGKALRAINDIVLVRRGSTQLIVEVRVGDDLYARLAGDGVIVATPLGSSAYSMAAGGPLLVAGTRAFLCTPLAMHGGCAPPLTVPADRGVVLDVDPGYGGFDLEFDGHRIESSTRRFAVSMEDGYATLVSLRESDTGLGGLRDRGLITDSPRLLARDARTTSSTSKAPG
jgi:NAD+ kinase